MRLGTAAVVLCATSALLYACSSDDDSLPGGDAGAPAAGASGKSSVDSAGQAGSGNGAGADDAGGVGNSGNMGNAAGEGGMTNDIGHAGDGGDGGEAGRATSSRRFTVTLENIAPIRAFTRSGVFNTPVGDAAPGPATPGKKYEFTVDAGRKQKLSFATMLAATNDLFYGPNGDGIALYDNAGNPIAEAM